MHTQSTESMHKQSTEEQPRTGTRRRVCRSNPVCARSKNFCARSKNRSKGQEQGRAGQGHSRARVRAPRRPGRSQGVKEEGSKGVRGITQGAGVYGRLGGMAHLIPFRELEEAAIATTVSGRLRRVIIAGRHGHVAGARGVSCTPAWSAWPSIGDERSHGAILLRLLRVMTPRRQSPGARRGQRWSAHGQARAR